jgi:hypothetical protein
MCESLGNRTVDLRIILFGGKYYINCRRIKKNEFTLL